MAAEGGLNTMPEAVGGKCKMNQQSKRRAALTASGGNRQSAEPAEPTTTVDQSKEQTINIGQDTGTRA
jgi:hypothetical protein